MTDDEIIQIAREHFEGFFPKYCNNCGRYFATLRQYILDTTRVKGTISYDAELGDWETKQPIGAVALANCPCGTTMALSTEGIPLSKIHLMLKWLKVESERKGLSPKELAEHVRDELRKRVLADSDL